MRFALLDHLVTAFQFFAMPVGGFRFYRAGTQLFPERFHCPDRFRRRKGLDLIDNAHLVKVAISNP